MPSVKIRGTANEQDIITHRLDGVDTRLDGIDKRLDGMDTRLDGMDTRLDGMDTRLDGIDKRLHEKSVVLARLDTKMNIVMGILGAAGAGACFLLIRLLLA